ncbi:hypothetical protein HPB50_014807 [Hyalomma asiaticum]|uniref:Uncharacterized protein n=1 Tax=Hyalomma asiaticum TaxID=266040 RepID=A0ACB7SL88_HYAAI|nr:hypothetical protein HPB50_014807 [Hyalomma asiaticum]
MASEKEPNPSKSSSPRPEFERPARRQKDSPEPGPQSPASVPRSPSTGLPCSLPNIETMDTLSALQNSVYLVLDHGPYQRRCLACGILCVTVVLMQELALRLIGQPVDHWCKPPRGYGHLSTDQWRNQSIPVEADGSFSACTMYDPAELVEGFTNRTVIKCDTWNYDRDPQDSIVSQFDLVCDRSFLYDFSTTMPIIGYALMSPVAGVASDRLGRRPVTLVLAITVLISSLCSSVPARFAFFVTTRVVTVSSANAAYLLTFILVYEVTGNARRPLFTLLHYAVASTVVPPFLDTIALMRPSWILSHGLLAVPTLAFVIWCLHLEESPVWQLATWRLRQAEANVLAAASLNGVDVGVAKADFHKILRRLRKMERSMEPTASTMASDGIFHSPIVLRCATAAFFTRFSTCAIYYGIMIADPPSGFPVEAAHVVLTMVVYVLIVRSMSQYGIRVTLTATLLALSWSGLVEAVLTFSQYGAAAAFAHAVTKALVSCALGVVLCYTGEVFPTHHRSAGVSLALFFGGMGALTGTYIMKSAAGEAALVFKVFIGVMALCSVVAIQWLPQVFIEKVQKRKSRTSMNLKGRNATRAPLTSPALKKTRQRKVKNVKSSKTPKSPL